jgi:hypothetical protein
VWTGEWLFGVVIYNWTFCTWAWLVQMSDNIHCVSLCPSRCVEVVNMVAVAAVHIQSRAGNTQPPGIS